jgi:hypothetical protein
MTRALSIVAGLAALMHNGASTAEGQSAPREALSLDHVIVGVSDLDRGVREFAERFGVTPTPGGRHPGRGTQNALVSLGARTYLEILAPDPTQPPIASQAYLADLASLTVVDWVIGTTNIEATAARLKQAGYNVPGPAPGSRQRPNGELLQWRTLNFESGNESPQPFVIEWSPGSAHPSTTSATGCQLKSLEIVRPNPEPASKLVKLTGLAVAVHRGAPARMRLVMSCPKGELVIG